MTQAQCKSFPKFTDCWAAIYGHNFQYRVGFGSLLAWKQADPTWVKNITQNNKFMRFQIIKWVQIISMIYLDWKEKEYFLFFLGKIFGFI